MLCVLWKVEKLQVVFDIVTFFRRTKAQCVFFVIFPIATKKKFLCILSIVYTTSSQNDQSIAIRMTGISVQDY